MERRVGLRARTDFGVIKRNGSVKSHCRGIELSTAGIIVASAAQSDDREERMLVGLELRLPERIRPVRTLARPVWSYGKQHAFKFVSMQDADRLTVAEHMDVLRLRGVQMC